MKANKLSDMKSKMSHFPLTKVSFKGSTSLKSLIFILISMIIFTADVFGSGGNIMSIYRWRNDDGSESAATWKAAENTGITLSSANTNFRLRIAHSGVNFAPSGTPGGYSLEYSADQVDWSTITSDRTTNAFALSPTTYFNDGDATTQQLLSTSDFTPWYCISSSEVSPAPGSTDVANELEWCLQATTHAISGTTYYFRTINANSAVTYDVTASLNFEITSWDGSESSDWNTAGNWSTNAVPTASEDVTIPGTGSGVTNWPIVNEAPATPAVCYSLTIDAGGLLSINSGKALTVKGTLTNNEGMTGLSIESDLADGSGSLLHHTANIPAWFSVTIPGAAELTDFKYHLVSVPLTPASNSTSIIFDGLYLYDFDVAGNDWNSLGTSTTTILNETKGYMVYKLGGDIKLLFEGNMNAGAFSSTVVNAGSGYNLVPNPYPSSIDWNAASGWTKTNINNATWIWNCKATEPFGEGIVGNYAAYVNGTGTNGGSRYIAPGQAFFVKTNAASPVLEMNDDVRIHNATPFLKSGESIVDLLRIEAKANNYSDEVVIRFTGEATPEADAAFDAEKMYGIEQAPQLYTLTPDLDKLSINSLPFSAGSTEVPMSFELVANTSCTLTFDEMESFEPETNIFIEDLLTGAKINLRQQKVYTFDHLTGNDPDRFKLWFGNVTAIPETTTQMAKMWINSNNLYINTTELKGQQALVEVYKASGQRLLMKSMVLDELTTFELSLKGFVIVKLTAGNKVMTAKGILN